MKDGWTRFKSSDVLNSKFRLSCYIYHTTVTPWLSQANHVFSALRITGNFANYVVVSNVYFTLNILGTAEDHPSGYLFLCPGTDFQTGPLSFRWPECPAYWSLDPSGSERLTTEQAARLVFPSMEFTTNVWGLSWDADVYAGLRQFHQAKGFDPDSQDVARHFECPLFEFSSKMHIPFAHVSPKEDEYHSSDEEDVENIPDTTCDDQGFSNAAGCSEAEISGFFRRNHRLSHIQEWFTTPFFHFPFPLDVALRFIPSEAPHNSTFTLRIRPRLVRSLGNLLARVGGAIPVGTDQFGALVPNLSRESRVDDLVLSALVLGLGVGEVQVQDE
ncbi:hypothetical protein MVEN_02597500 [Mycena venus]|uniref:Uncharacterized protein n=1 Tax=Mycena venus TaxID=2733690 RepID=A0A8H6TZ55_9AGAR|nr:hypothetical protein MVEN_02597500 [Mycena venus]